MKTHKQYINEQIKKEPKFAEALAKAEQEVGIAVELARLRERRGLSQTELAKLTGMKQPADCPLGKRCSFPCVPNSPKASVRTRWQIGSDRGRLPSRSNTTKGRQRAAVVGPQYPECREISNSQWRETMKHRAARRHTHLQLDHAKLTRATTVLGTKAETEAIERALALIVKEHTLDQPLRRAKGRMQLQRVFR